MKILQDIFKQGFSRSILAIKQHFSCNKDTIFHIFDLNITKSKQNV